MTDLREVKHQLRAAIMRYANSVGTSEQNSEWQVVNGAITALDNAAYARAYEKAHMRCHAECYDDLIGSLVTERHEVKRLQRELELSEERWETEADQADQILKERDQARQDLEFAEHRREQAETEIDALRTTSVTLLGALGRIEVMSRNSINDENLLPALKRVQAEAWEAYRNAQATVLPIGEPIDISAPEQPNEIERLKQERDRLHQQWARCIKEGGRLRRELADARETIRKMAEGRVSVLRDECLRASRMAQRLLLDRDRLRSALETLADRYHFELCRMCSGEKSRQECGMKDGALRKAVEALAGESEGVHIEQNVVGDPHVARQVIEEELVRTLRNPYYCGCVRCKCGRIVTPPCDGPHSVYWLHECRECSESDDSESVDASGGHVSGGRVFSETDRKPKEEPEIEAVLMGTAIKCHESCGCDRVVDPGQCAYRFPQTQSQSMQPLYASEACARKAARPRARTHPPYAAYTRFCLRAEEEERRLRKPPEAPTTPYLKVVYACSGSDGCGWSGSTRDLSPRGRCPKCWRDVAELDVVEKLP